MKLQQIEMLPYALPMKLHFSHHKKHGYYYCNWPFSLARYWVLYPLFLPAYYWILCDQGHERAFISDPSKSCRVSWCRTNHLPCWNWRYWKQGKLFSEKLVIKYRYWVVSLSIQRAIYLTFDCPPSNPSFVAMRIVTPLLWQVSLIINQYLFFASSARTFARKLLV